MVCASETIAAMTSKDGFRTVAGKVSFRRCNHETPEGADHCPTCYRGCTGYLSVIASMAVFSDRPLANKLHKILRHLADNYGYSRHGIHRRT
jgi:hypothetical protein